jgi:hypothetical protein
LPGFPVLLNDDRSFVAALKKIQEFSFDRKTFPILLDDDRGLGTFPVVDDFEKMFSVSGHPPTTLENDGRSVATFEMKEFYFSTVSSFCQESEV